MTRVLYSGTKNASSWAMRAWLALREQELEFVERVIDIRPPARWPNLAAIAEFSPPGAVPVLVDDDVVIFDSLAIMEYASELGVQPLLPADSKQKAHVRSLLAWQHSGLSQICAQLSFESSFYPDKRAMTLQEQTESRRLFSVWEKELQGSHGPYLAGKLSLADLAFVPTVIRLLSHQPDLLPWPLVREWSAHLLARASVQEWMNEALTLPVVRLDDYRSPLPEPS